MVKERVSAKQYGVRYGRKNREKIGKLDKDRRDSNICPYCHYQGKVKRLAAGIWYCGKCKSKFTGRAYVIGKKLESVEMQEAEEEPVVLRADMKEEEFEEELHEHENFGERVGI